MIYFLKFLILAFTILIPLVGFVFFDFIHKDLVSILIVSTFYLSWLFILICICLIVSKIFKWVSKLCEYSPPRVVTKILDDDVFDKYAESKVEPLKNIITSYNNNKFLSIGLFGKWGSGKSSYVKALQKELQNEHIVISVNVWKLGNTANIIKEVEINLDNQIFKHSCCRWLWYKIISFIAKNYFQILEKYILKDTVFVDFKITQTIEDSKKSFSKLLKKSFGNKKLIIIFDELDRLTEIEEIYKVFNTIRYLTSFDNTISITAVDIKQLESIVDNIEYIHKIFNVKYSLPQITKNDLMSFCEEISKNFSDFGLKENAFIDLLQFQDEQNNTKIIDMLETYREVKNAYNDTYLVLTAITSDEKYRSNWQDYISFDFIVIASVIKAISFEAYSLLFIDDVFKQTVYKFQDQNLLYEDYTENFDAVTDGNWSKLFNTNEKLSQNTKNLLSILNGKIKDVSSYLHNCIYVYQHNQIYDYLVTTKEFEDYKTKLQNINEKLNRLIIDDDKINFLQNIIGYLHSKLHDKIFEQVITILIDEKNQKLDKTNIFKDIILTSGQVYSLVKDSNQEILIKLVQTRSTSHNFIEVLIEEYCSYFHQLASNNEEIISQNVVKTLIQEYKKMEFVNDNDIKNLKKEIEKYSNESSKELLQLFDTTEELELL